MSEAAAEEVVNEDKAEVEAVIPVVSEVAEEMANPTEERTELPEEMDKREQIAQKYAEKNYNLEAVPDPVTLDEPEEIEVKINGRVRTVSKDKIDAAGGLDIYQKSIAANEGLQDLAAQRKQLQMQSVALQQERTRFAEEKTKATSQPSPPIGDQKEIKNAAREYREALLDGDDAKADKLFVQWVGMQKATPEIDVRQIEASVTQKTVQTLNQQRAQQEIVVAKQSFEKEFAEIMEDPRLFQMADKETEILMQEQPTWTAQQIMTEAGNRIRSWRGTEKTSDRVAEKRAMNAPKAAAGRAKAKPTVKPQTNSDYVSQLRKSRGLE